MHATRFVTLEGVEGAGKSTVAHVLQGALERAGARVLLTREPGGTPLAEAMRTLLLRRDSEQISPVAETLMMFAARSVHLDNAVRPALAAGKWVLCDRFTDATFAYQGAGRGVEESLIAKLAGAIHPELWPARTLLLDLPVAEGLERARRRGAGADRFESEQVAFFERVRAGYLARAAAEPRRIRVIDARAEAQVVGAAALAAIDDLLADWQVGGGGQRA